MTNKNKKVFLTVCLSLHYITCTSLYNPYKTMATLRIVADNLVTCYTMGIEVKSSNLTNTKKSVN